MLTVNTDFHGCIAYSEEFQARMILYRLCKAAARRPVTIEDNHDPRFIVLQRRGGNPHVTDGVKCNCIAGTRGVKCWAVKVIEAFGGVARVRSAERLDQ